MHQASPRVLPRPLAWPAGLTAPAALATCALVGALGGATIWRLGLASFATGVLLGALYGALFALSVGWRASSPGAGLLWGLGTAFLLWLAGPAGLFPALGGGQPMGMLDA